MKKSIKLSLIGLFTLLVSGMTYSIEEAQLTRSRINSEKNYETTFNNFKNTINIKDREYEAKLANLEKTQKMSDESWTHHDDEPSSNKFDTEADSKLTWSSLDNAKKKISYHFKKFTSFFSDLFNIGQEGKVKNGFKNYSDSQVPGKAIDNKTKEAFKKLDPDIQLKYINQFVDLERNKRNENLDQNDKTLKEEEKTSDKIIKRLDSQVKESKNKIAQELKALKLDKNDADLQKFNSFLDNNLIDMTKDTRLTKDDLDTVKSLSEKLKTKFKKTENSDVQTKLLQEATLKDIDKELNSIVNAYERAYDSKYALSTSKVDKYTTSHTIFNERLNKFRQEINDLFPYQDRHLVYNTKTQQFEFHNGRAEDARNGVSLFQRISSNEIGQVRGRFGVEDDSSQTIPATNTSLTGESELQRQERERQAEAASRVDRFTMNFQESSEPNQEENTLEQAKNNLSNELYTFTNLIDNKKFTTLSEQIKVAKTQNDINDIKREIDRLKNNRQESSTYNKSNFQGLSPAPARPNNDTTQQALTVDQHSSLDANQTSNNFNDSSNDDDDEQAVPPPAIPGNNDQTKNWWEK